MSLEDGKISQQGFIAKVATVVAVSWALFQFYAARFWIDFNILKFTHLTFGLALAFLIIPSRKRKNGKDNWWMALDLSLALLTTIPLFYFLIFFERFKDRMPFVSVVTTGDFIIGILILLAVFETTRRAVGIPMVIIAILAIIYELVGPYIPGVLRHSGVELVQLLEYQFLSLNEGILGIPITASATYVFIFILFGSFLAEGGTGQYFIDLAFKLFGRAVGGPGKVSCLSSALFGTISGSAVANVMVDGWLTIPMMQKAGFRKEVACAIEATASTGGQIMPPVMGAAAFVMAEILGIPYREVAIAAILPALLYYAGVYAAVHFNALHSGIKPMTDVQTESWKSLSKRAYQLIPLAAVIWYIYVGYSPARAAFMGSIYAILVIIISNFLAGRGKSSLSERARSIFKILFNSFEAAGKSSVVIVAACATAGIIMGTIAQSGLGISISRILIGFSGGIDIIVQIITMIVALILGMGMPTVAAYIMVSIVLTPALLQLGHFPLAAHLFVFYFSIISFVTPPVALAAYAAAGIGKANPWKVGGTAFRFTLGGFLAPFLFINETSLLLRGPLIFTVLNFLSAVGGIALLQAFFEGHALLKLSKIERILVLFLSIFLIIPGAWISSIGLILFVGFMSYQMLKRRILRRKAPISSTK